MRAGWKCFFFNGTSQKHQSAQKRKSAVGFFEPFFQNHFFFLQNSNFIYIYLASLYNKLSDMLIFFFNILLKPLLNLYKHVKSVKKIYFVYRQSQAHRNKFWTHSTQSYQSKCIYMCIWLNFEVIKHCE